MIKMAVTPSDLPYPKTARKLYNSTMFYKTGLTADRSFTLREYRFSTFFAAVTLTFSWPDDHIRTWPAFAQDIPDERKWTSYVKVFESYRFTDIHTDVQTPPKLYTTPLRGWPVMKIGLTDLPPNIHWDVSVDHSVLLYRVWRGAWLFVVRASCRDIEREKNKNDGVCCGDWLPTSTSAAAAAAARRYLAR